MIVIRLPDNTVFPLTVSYANNGAPTPITKAAKVPPTERQVDKLARSLASAEMADAIEP